MCLAHHREVQSLGILGEEGFLVEFNELLFGYVLDGGNSLIFPVEPISVLADLVEEARVLIAKCLVSLQQVNKNGILIHFKLLIRDVFDFVMLSYKEVIN